MSVTQRRSCAPDAAQHERVMRCRAGAHASVCCVICWVPALHRTATRCVASGTRERRARLPPTPSLRAQRSDPEFFRGGSLDRFAALAMTRMKQLCSITSLSRARIAF